MHKSISRKRAILSAIFVLAVFATGAMGVVVVANRQWRIQPTFLARAEFNTIGGINLGDKVRVQGIDAGVVERIEAPAQPGGMVTLWFRLDEKLHRLVRADAKAFISSQGVVGAKVIEIVPGLPDAPILPEAGRIASETTPELSDLIRNATGALKRVDAVATAAEIGLREVNTIATSIREGKGSLGRLVQDEEAYRKLVALSDRGSRTLNDVQENLAALKRTWPLSRYFDDRAFYDRERVLYKPGADRVSRTLNPDTLFEPGRSVLTPSGRTLLDEIGGWFKRTKTNKTEMVIASFSDDFLDPDLTQILTQEQADSVRRYLVERHSVDTVGWFGSRKVAAIGFGNQVPRGSGEGMAASTGPKKRVEIILFTPRT
jgi:phospholipid/cholesterol/gamma-HCH transport system substrate-binding protein